MLLSQPCLVEKKNHVVAGGEQADCVSAVAAAAEVAVSRASEAVSTKPRTRCCERDQCALMLVVLVAARLFWVSAVAVSRWLYWQGRLPNSFKGDFSIIVPLRSDFINTYGTNSLCGMALSVFVVCRL